MGKPETVRSVGLAGGALILVTAALPLVGPASARPLAPSPGTIANGCFAMQAAATHRYVALTAAQGYGAQTDRRSAAAPLYLKPTDIDTYLLYDADGGMLAAANDSVTRTTTPGPSAEWRVASKGGDFTLTATADQRQLIASRSGSLGLAAPGTAGRSGRFAF
ncbi:MAG: hypothetical protein ACTHK4_00445, partial [Mycobacteriales bacterium]